MKVFIAISLWMASPFVCIAFPLDTVNGKELGQGKNPLAQLPQPMPLGPVAPAAFKLSEFGDPIDFDWSKESFTFSKDAILKVNKVATKAEPLQARLNEIVQKDLVKAREKKDAVKEAELILEVKKLQDDVKPLLVDLLKPVETLMNEFLEVAKGKGDIANVKEFSALNANGDKNYLLFTLIEKGTNIEKLFVKIEFVVKDGEVSKAQVVVMPYRFRAIGAQVQ